MIRLIIIALVFFIVIAISPLLVDEKGYILISIGNITIESTVLSAIIMLSLIFTVLTITFKVLRGGLHFSFGAWHKFSFASQKRGIANFNKGLAAYMLEDYEEAENLFSKSAEPSKRKQSAYLLAAAASSKQQLSTNTNHYLDLLEKEVVKSEDMSLEGVIVKIKLLMNQGSQEAFDKSRVIIDKHHKQIGHDSRLLSLEIDLCLIEKRFEQAIEHLIKARKEKHISSHVIQIWENKAFYGLFSTKILQHDQNALQSYWQKLSKKIKQREEVLFAYCQVLAEQNITEPLTKIIQPILMKSPSHKFLLKLRHLPIKQNEPLIALVQKHLHKDSQSAKWLSCLGHLALMSEQWSMAERAFGSLIKLETIQSDIPYDKEDLQAFAKALSEQEQYKAANEVLVKISEM